GAAGGDRTRAAAAGADPNAAAGVRPDGGRTALHGPRGVPLRPEGAGPADGGAPGGGRGEGDPGSAGGAGRGGGDLPRPEREAGAGPGTPGHRKRAAEGERGGVLRARG